MQATAENVSIGTAIRYHDENGIEFTGVVIDVNYGAMRVQWDDGEPPSLFQLGDPKCEVIC